MSEIEREPRNVIIRKSDLARYRAIETAARALVKYLDFSGRTLCTAPMIAALAIPSGEKPTAPEHKEPSPR